MGGNVWKINRFALRLLHPSLDFAVSILVCRSLGFGLGRPEPDVIYYYFFYVVVFVVVALCRLRFHCLLAAQM